MLFLISNYLMTNIIIRFGFQSQS